MQIIACPDFSGVQTIYDIIKALGGKISVDSLENEGTIFIIELPLN